jgi:signal transduction histidine kinase
MELFAHNDEVVRLETALPLQKGEARILGLLALAWYLRQSDSHRSLLLLEQLASLLENVSLPDIERVRIESRTRLVQAEIKWLTTDLNSAVALAETALQHFTALQDYQGCADSYWLLGAIAIDKGDSGRSTQARSAAVSAARASGDQVRIDIAEAAIACSEALRNPKQAWQNWGQRFWPEMPGVAPAAQVWIYDFLAIVEFMQSDFGRAAGYWMHTYEASMSTGQIRRAVVTATNIGDAFNSLNEHHGALDWMQRGLNLARQYAWSGSLGICLAQTGETLRRLGRYDAAQELLQEALIQLSPLASSRNYATALAYIGELKLAQGEFEEALQMYQEFQRRAEVLNQADFETRAQRGQAQALLHLGQPDAALAAANAAFALAQMHQSNFRQIDALSVLAEIYAKYTLPDPPDMQAESAPLHFLLLAQKISAGIVGYNVNGDLQDLLANEYARLGQFENAYQIAMQAKQERMKTQTEEANHRAVALQVQQQTERVRADLAHHRQLAIAEAKRAEVLQQTTITLECLSAVGQEITAQLDRDAVFQVLNRYAHSLMEVNSFMIYLLDPGGDSVSRVFGIEDGNLIQNDTISLSEKSSNTVRCLCERRELLQDFAPNDAMPKLIPGTLGTLTALFSPVMVGDRVLGVLSVQAMRRFAFGERERLVFRTLCAYGAIALDNAYAYQQLQVAQAYMMGQEKLAALGALVAGVAHELNTPIGNSLMMGGAFQERIVVMRDRVLSPAVQRSELLEFIDEAEETSAVIVRGLTSAAELVRSFKQVAVDRTTAHQRVFDLAQTTHEILATMGNQIRIAGHTLIEDIPPNIMLHSYPGPYGQVITNLINNAMLHAFDGRTGGKMYLSARQVVPNRVQIQFRDDGGGISEQNQCRIFEPFFTTKLGQGGSGLGLSISYDIVTSLLNGQFQCESRVGQGTTFTLDLPLKTSLQAFQGD